MAPDNEQNAPTQVTSDLTDHGPNSLSGGGHLLDNANDKNTPWDSEQTITGAGTGTALSKETRGGTENTDKEKNGHHRARGNESDRRSGSSTDLAVEVVGAHNNEEGRGKHEEEEDNGQNPIPDGGTRAWLVVLGAWCVSFCSYGWINSIGTFQEYYQSGPLSSYSTSEISWIPSLQIFFMSFLGPIIGHIYDRHGMRLLLVLGSTMHVFGLMMASISSQYYQFLLSQGVCSAIGVAICFICAISSVTGWFDRRRGLAFGLLATGSSLGGVVFPILLSRLIETVGYGWAMRTSAFIILCLLVVANLALKTNRPRKAPGPRSGATSIRSSVRGRGGWMNFLHPFREVPFVLLLGGQFLVPFGLYVPINYMPVASVGAGMTKDMSQNMVAIYNGASAIGRFSSGFISDKAGRFNVFITSCYLSGLLILAMWVPVSATLPHATTVSIAFAAMFGVFSGGYISLLASLVAAISPIDEIGYRNGLTFLFASVGGLTTSPIAGAILEASGGPDGRGNWVGLKTFAGVLLIAGTSFVLAARIRCVGWKFTEVF